MAKSKRRLPNDDKCVPLSQQSVDRSYKEACRLYNEGEDEKALHLLNRLLEKGDLGGNAVLLLDSILRPYGRVVELSDAYQKQIEWLNAAIQNGWPTDGCESFEDQRSRHRNVIRLLTQDLRPITFLDYDQPAVRCQNAWLFRGRFNLGATRISTAPGCIRLSFVETGDLSDREQAEIRQVVFREFSDRTPSFVSRAIREIHIFRFAMRLDDPIIAFDAKMDAWNVGRVLGAYDWDAISSPHFAHTRSVKWTNHIPHRDLPSAISFRLRKLRTVQDIPSDLWKSIRSFCVADGQRKAATNAPVWSQHAYVKNAPANERELFKATFAGAVARGTFLDVNGQVAYVWDYLQDQLRLLRKGRDHGPILSLFNELRAAYGSEPSLIEFLDLQLSELFLHLGDSETAWKYLRRLRVDANGVLNVRAKCKCQTLDANDLLNVARAREYLTNWGRANLKDVDLAIEAQLRKEYTESGGNPIVELCSRVNALRLTEHELCWLREICTGREQEFDRLRSFYGGGPQADGIHRDFYQGGVNERQPILFLGRRSKSNPRMIRETLVPPLLELACRCRVGGLVRDAENRVRVARGIPQIGAGWVGETELFNRIKAAFPGLDVLHHFKAPWLGKQHVDVFITELNMAIEYQGEQHDRPVSRFGGEHGLRQTQLRDEEKRRKCAKRGVILVEVRPDEPIEAIVSLIQKAADIWKQSQAQ